MIAASTISSSWSWRHRFYAFLLRRALGPFLTPQSAAELHRSIQAIDWTEGKFALVDVELDPAYLTSVVQGNHGGEKKNGDDEEKEGRDGGGGVREEENGRSDATSSGTNNNISVHRARIRRFAIRLGVCDVDPRGETTSSAARKATSAFLQSMFGTSDNNAVDDGETGASTGIALVAHVEMEGLDIVLAPGEGADSESNSATEWTSTESHTHNQPLTPNNDQEQTDVSAPGFFSSLVDSAMKSLRLSVDISDVNVRAYSHHCDVGAASNDDAFAGSNLLAYDRAECGWVTLRLASARYYDMIGSKDGDAPASGVRSGSRRSDGGRDHSNDEKIVISKAFDWEGIAVDTGHSGGIRSKSLGPASLLVFQSSGGGKARFRVFEKWSKSEVDQKATCLSARQDIEISLGQRMSVNVDPRSMTLLVEIANAMSKTSGEDGDFVDACGDDNCRTWEDASDSVQRECAANAAYQPALADEFSKETYDHIIKQYTEARHLARTRELRGGVLIPSFNDDANENIGGDISFDAFFDANDHSVGYYCSMVDETMSGGERNCSSKESGHRSMKQTKIELGLPEFTVKIHQYNLRSTSQDWQSEYVLLSLGDLRVIVFGSTGESKVNCSVSHFDVESQVVDAHGAIINEPLLRFLDDPDGGSGSELLLSSPPCISMMAELSEAEDEAQACRVDMVLQPLEIVCQEQALGIVTAIFEKIPRAEPAPSDEGDNNKPMNLHLSVSSSSILLMAPCQHRTKQMIRDAKPNPLFQRHGYRDHGSGGSKFLGLGIELDNVTIDISRKASSKMTLEESKAALKCSHMILFAKGTELERGRRKRKFSSYISRRVDLIAFTGDEDSRSDASIVISYSTVAQQSSSSFPIVLPLSSTKARQEMESDGEIDDLYADALNSTSVSSRIQSSDPQYILSSEANEAERELVINIPIILIDSITSERQALSDLLSNIRLDDNDAEYSNSKQAPSHSTNLNGKNRLGLAVDVGQISVVLHGSNLTDSNSYSLIMDKMQIHSLFGSSGVRNFRFLTNDVTLYEQEHELSNAGPAPKANKRIQCPTSCIEKCKRIQERLASSPSAKTRAIFFRQKLCQSLSPETPAFLVDVLLRGDDECGEMSVHINAYDMTYRYVMNSEWIQNLSALIKGESTEKESGEAYSARTGEGGPQQEENDDRASSSLTNLFVTLADCNIDYSPPPTFNRPSRVILRMGEIRFTSSIVTPSAAVQAYKVSLSDLRVHICNYRHSYNEENSLLSLAHRHLNKDDIAVVDRARRLSGRNVVSLDHALCGMDFVNVAALDTLDAIIFKSNSSEPGGRQNDPESTAALTLGKMSIYACRDSFSCLNETYNEWFIKSTALSDEDIEKLRASPESQSIGVNEDISSEENDCMLPFKHQPPTFFRAECEDDDAPKVVETYGSIHDVSNETSAGSKQLQEHRDDTVSLDLTKTLLFQNYYTFDAKINHQELCHSPKAKGVTVKRYGGNETLQPSSCEDEWATVEHDFLRHTNIPRERDQSVEWVLCDPNASAPLACKADNPPAKPITVKVFPQHIPVRPNLDPFAGRAVDTAKLAGTDVAPNIGTRVIVKDGSITIRFFEGLDWLIDAPQPLDKERIKDRKRELLSGLIDGGKSASTFTAAPLPEERSKNLQRDIARKKLRRNAHRYFQISINGLKLKNDSFAESKEHQLASTLDLCVSDFFIAETISNGDPTKMMGEWINESEHPRDDSDGIIMLKMTTKHPKLRVSSDGKLMSDESRATLDLLPLRFYLNQNALRFIRSFFSGSPSETGEDDVQEDDGNDGIPDDEIIDIFFESFKVRPCKLKVDYQPETMDIDSFRDGNYVEILNLCPLEDMILALQPVNMQDLTGWGSVISELAGHWVEDICATQAHKFLTRAAPFQPLSNLGDPLADLAMVLVVPEGGVTNYVKSIVGGTTNFAGKVALEALSTSAKLTRFAANQLNTKALPSGRKSSLPRRPRRVPRHAGDTAGHAYESVSRGLREANYKIVTVPLREYQSNGAGGAARSALRGIPIGVIAPIAGASEALSYTLLGLRNQLRPDIRMEEEASLRGLHYD